MTFFFLKNVSRPSKPADELAQHVSKKIPSDDLRIRLFGLGELNQNGFGPEQYGEHVVRECL